MTSSQTLARTLVELTDSLVEEFDVVDLLTLLAARSVEALQVSAAGVMLAAPEGDLRVVASSSEAIRLVELFELQSGEGPGPDCFHAGEQVIVPRLVSARSRWPRFTPVALQAGFTSVYVLPMRLRGSVIGALTLFGTEQADLSGDDVQAGQALADVATLAVLQHPISGPDAQRVNEQLTYALNVRILIEQAKGVLAERAGVDTEKAFSAMRAYARDRHELLAEVAGAVVDGVLLAEAFDTYR